MKSSRLDGVEALRGFAALSVLVYHCIVLGPWPEFPRGLGLWFHFGWVGADLFFVISGFATTMAWLAIEHRADASVVYCRERLARIAPLFFLTSACYLIWVDSTAIRGSETWFQVLTHLTMTHGFFPTTAGSINGVTWTLTLELCLYVMGWIMLRFGAVREHRCAWAMGVISTALVYRALVFWLAPNSALHWVSQLPGLCDGFFMGLLLALFVSEGRQHILPSKMLLAAALALISLSIGLLEYFAASYWQTAAMVIGFRTLLATGLLALLWVASTLLSSANLRVIKPFAWFGSISYGIYLWHVPVLLLLKRHFDIEGGLAALTTLAITTLLAATSFYGFEKPITQWVKAKRQILER